jgi:hypothetical protein
MSEAFGGVTIADLGQTGRVADAAKRAGGLNGIVVGVVTDERNLAPAQRSPNLRVTCRLIDVDHASQVAIKNEELPLTIADMAMMGESFELRRWVNGRVDNIALTSSDSRMIPVEFSSVSRIGPADVNSRQHPLSDPSFPFPVQLVVDKQPRSPVFIKGKPYVTVDPGEEYSVRVRNNSGKDVYVAVFVDGINVLGKRRDHVANCKYWHLATGETSNFRGWYTGSAGHYTEERFYIARRRETVAVKAGFGEDLGMITVALYTVGAPSTDPQRLAQARPSFGEEGEWVQDPGTRQWRWKAKVKIAYSEAPATAPSMAPSQARTLGALPPKASSSHQFKAKATAPMAAAPGFGTGAGTQREVLVGQIQGGPVGLLLAAVTLYYRTTSELNAMR